MREYRTALSYTVSHHVPLVLWHCYRVTTSLPLHAPPRPTIGNHPFPQALCSCFHPAHMLPTPCRTWAPCPTPPYTSTRLQHHLHWWSPALSASSRAGGHMWTTAEPWYPFGQIPCLPTPTRPQVPRGAHRSQLDLIWAHNYRGTRIKGQRGPVQVPWSIMQPTFQTLIVKTSNHPERETRKKIKGNCTRKQTTFLLFLNQILKTYFIQIRFEKNSQNIKFLHNLSSI